MVMHACAFDTELSRKLAKAEAPYYPGMTDNGPSARSINLWGGFHSRSLLSIDRIELDAHNFPQSYYGPRPTYR